MKFWLAPLCIFVCVSCDKIMPDEKKSEEDDLATPEQREAVEKFGKRLPEG